MSDRSRQYSPVSVWGEIELKRKRPCAPVRNSSLSRTNKSANQSFDLDRRLSTPVGWMLSTYKLNVIYPSRSVSYFLKTSVILFKLIQACTNKSKLSTLSLTPSSPRPLECVFAYVPNSN